ncbi:MAG: T9SS type A sorting domain-containing protein, partial [Fidelibacterota bacterium]
IQSQNPDARALFTPTIPASGLYNIYYAGPLTSNASNHALFEVHPFGADADSVWLNQNSGSGCEWKLIGTYYLYEGDFNSVFIVNDGTGAGFVIRADLMKFVTVPDRFKIIVPITSYNFEDVKAQQTEDYFFNIKNVGGREGTIEELSTKTGYIYVSSPTTFPQTIPALDSLKVTVTFAPTQVTSYRDTLVIKSSDIDNPEINVILTGNAIGAQVIVDDTSSVYFEAGPTDTTWNQSSSLYGNAGTSLYTDKRANPFAWAKWTPDVPYTMEYLVFVSSVPSSAQWTVTKAPYIIQPFGTDTVMVIRDQTVTSNDNIWIYLGRFMFSAGTSGYVMVYNDTTITYQEDAGGDALRADALKLTEPGVGIEYIFYPTPGDYSLSQNYPNPFNVSTTINYTIKRRGVVKIAVYNILGQEIKTLVNEYRESGPHSVKWDGLNNSGKPVSSGIYLYRMETGRFSSTRKLLLLK